MLQELPNCQFVLTYKLEDLKKKIHMLYDGIFDNVFIHILTNDISKIVCQENLKPNVEREEELYEFAKEFNTTILETASNMPDTDFFVSLCLPRYDHKDHLGVLSGRDLVNNEIKKSLKHIKNITLVSNENFSRMDFLDSDLFHLTASGFCKLMSNWTRYMPHYI